MLQYASLSFRKLRAWPTTSRTLITFWSIFFYLLLFLFDETQLETQSTMWRIWSSAYLHSTDDGPYSPKPVCYLIKSAYQWCYCVNRLNVSLLPPILQLAFATNVSSQVMSLEVKPHHRCWASVQFCSFNQRADTLLCISFARFLSEVWANRPQQNPAYNWCLIWVTV